VRRSLGLSLLVAFFIFGSVMASLAFLGLLFPDGALEPMWRLNRDAQVGLLELGRWGLLLMFAVAIVCVLAAIGLARRARWGHRLAVTAIAVNLLSDLFNAVVLGDLRTLIGIPIGGAVIWYLMSARTRAQFEIPSAAV
jgi:hypothetical protein